MLIGTWDGIYRRLHTEGYNEAEKIQKEWEIDAGNLDLSVSDAANKVLRKRRDRNTRFREWLKTGSRSIGLLNAATIAIAFFSVPKGTSLPWWAYFAIAFTAFFPVLAVLFIWLNNSGLKKIRNQENEILRQVGQSSRAMDAAADDRTIDTVAEKITPLPDMNRDGFVRLVERLVQEGHISGPVTCRSSRGGRPFLCVDNRTRTDLVAHLQAHNPHRDPPDVRSLSNGMWVAVPRSNGWRRERARQLLRALGLDPDDYL